MLIGTSATEKHRVFQPGARPRRSNRSEFCIKKSSSTPVTIFAREGEAPAEPPSRRHPARQEPRPPL
jgi:hypothetical protein